MGLIRSQDKTRFRLAPQIQWLTPSNLAAHPCAALGKLLIRASLTACRPREVREATWDEVDVDAAVWTVPGDRTKTGSEHRVPLSDRAMAVVEEARAFRENDLLFPAATGRKMSDSTLSKLLRELGIGAVPHGFRSTFRDWCGEMTNAPRELAEAALGHKVGNVVE